MNTDPITNHPNNKKILIAIVSVVVFITILLITVLVLPKVLNKSETDNNVSEQSATELLEKGFEAKNNNDLDTAKEYFLDAIEKYKEEAGSDTKTSDIVNAEAQISIIEYMQKGSAENAQP